MVLRTPDFQTPQCGQKLINKLIKNNMAKFLNIIKNFITVFFIGLLIVDATDKLILILKREYFLFALYIGSFYLIAIFILLISLSLSLRKSEIKWQKVLGSIGIFIVIVDLVVNIMAFIWNFIR